MRSCKHGIVPADACQTNECAFRDRRERIAVVVLGGFAASMFEWASISETPASYMGEAAVRWAEALIAELDK